MVRFLNIIKSNRDNGEWKELLKDKKLKDFDWSSDNHILNHATINTHGRYQQQETMYMIL